MKMDQWPMSHSFAWKNQDFDGPIEISMGHLERKDGSKNLNIHPTANEHQIWIAYVWGLAKIEIKITLSLIVFS